MSNEWIEVCGIDEIEMESAKRFDYDGKTFVICRNNRGEFFCLDGLCTHEDVHLVDGLVIDNTIECPKHSSIFNFTTGDVMTPPACHNLQTYPVRIAHRKVKIRV